MTSGADRPLSVALAVRTDGKAYLAFHDNRSGNNDVYVREYDPWVNQWGASTLASDDAGSAAQQSPTVAYTSSEVMLGWRDDRSGNADVRARRAALAGGVDHFGFTYDGLNRLTAESGALAETFVFDGASNQSSRTGPSATYVYDTSNRLTSDGAQSYVWNSADRLMSRGSDTFALDPLGRLVSTTIAGTTRGYMYSADGLMATRTQGANTTNLVWDSGAPAKLMTIASDRIVYGLGSLYAVRGDNSTITFARDGAGNVRAEVDATGLIAGSYRYRLYGSVSQATGNGPTYFGFGELMVDPSGLNYARARWYDPSTGRFVSRDPVEGTSSSPNSLNGYDYANANPLTFSDPTGLDPTRGRNLDTYLNQRAAYAIGQFFADLDSPDPATRNRGYARLAVVGVGIAVTTVLVAHVAVAYFAGPGTLESAPAATGRIIVIGEDQDRVDAFVNAVPGAQTMPTLARSMPSAEKAVRGSNFIVSAMDEGALIVNLGRSPRAMAAGEDMHKYFFNELLDIAKRNYPRVLNWVGN